MYNLKMVECVHHWFIESPKGPKSAGTCGRCNQARFFSNSVDDISPMNDLSFTSPEEPLLPARNQVALRHELALDNYD